MTPLHPLALLAAAAPAALRSAQTPLEEFTCGPGLRVVPAATVRASFLALCVDGPGRLVLATERDGLLRAVDHDGDGVYEEVRDLVPDLALVQGLASTGSALFAVGASAGQKGLWRIPLDPTSGDPAEAPVLVAALEGDDEHGAHAVLVAPDGALLVSFGDSASFVAPPALPLPEDHEPVLRPPLADPSGFGARQRWPYGHVARVDPEGGSWTVLCHGLRNAYDLSLLEDGTLLTVDSDMEWDVGLPWYRPVRVLALEEGRDYGSRPGSAARPMQREDAPVLALGRGSPTGMALLTGERWPARWRGAVALGDWSNGRVLALHLERRGGDLWGASETLVAARDALPVTDLEQDARGLVFVAGGRGAVGRVLRLEWDGATEPPPFEWEPPSVEERARAELFRGRVRALTDLAARLVAGTASAGDVELARRECARFPSGDADVDRALADLIGAAGDDAARARLVDALAAEQDTAQALHYADVVRALDVQWDAPRLARALSVFERAASWPGGGNLQGYLDRMVRELLAHAAPEVLDALAAAGELGPRALATLLAQRAGEDCSALLAPLQTAFAALDEELAPTVALERKRALLRALAGARAPGLADWLRRVHDDEPRLREDALQRLAEDPRPADRARFVAGLASGRFEVRDEAVAALRRLEPRASADEARVALDQAKRRGARPGARLLALLAHWSGGASALPDDQPFDARLAAAERWFAREYPDWIAPARGPERGPAYGQDEVAAFLERAADRPGDSARGAAVFERLTCGTCHTLSGAGGGWGPDLTGVTRRFDRRTLLAAVMDPSREIAERYALSELTTADDERLEGRVVLESADALELLLADGTRRTIPRADVASLAPSPISAMPEGLLDGVALEDVRDLVAFLDADGTVAHDPDAPRWRPLFDDEERRHWGGSFAGWRLEDEVLLGEGPRTAGEALAYDAQAGSAREATLACDVYGEPSVDLDVALGDLFVRLAHEEVALLPDGPTRAVSPAGWHHLRIDLGRNGVRVEVDGALAVEAPPRATGDGVVTLLRPRDAGARAWIAHLRMLW